MKKKVSIIILLIIFLIAFDQLLKIFVINNYSEEIKYGIFSINLVKNIGVAFSMNNNNTRNIIITSVILILIIRFIIKQINKINYKTAISLCLILAGGISNLIDRITKGGVIDFIKIEKFSIFNLADCYVVIGWILFVIMLIKYNIGVKDCEKQ